MAYYLPWLSNTSGGSGVVTADIVASTTGGAGIEGVAPLAVHFDAIGTTRTGWTTSETFRRCVYTWDYGDTGSGTWSYGNSTNNSKNADVGGPLGFHVFESAGSYTVTLSVDDGNGNTDTATTTITVSDPDSISAFSGTNTICVNDSGTSDGLGPSGCTYQSTMPSASSANGKRVLMRRGQTTARSIPTSSGSQNLYFGAYGTGSKPVVNSVLMQHGSSGSSRIMDVQSTGKFNMNCSNALNLRCDISISDTTDTATVFGTTAGSGNFAFNAIYFVECIIEGNVSPGGGDPIFAGSKRNVTIGCSLGDCLYHTVRQSPLYKSIIAHNNIGTVNSSTVYDGVKIHSKSLSVYDEGVSSDSGTWATQYVVVANNIIGQAGYGVNYSLSFASQNNSSAEQCYDAIIEDNGFYLSNLYDIALAASRILSVDNYRVGSGGAIAIGASANAGPGVTTTPNYTDRTS